MMFDIEARKNEWMDQEVRGMKGKCIWIHDWR